MNYSDLSSTRLIGLWRGGDGQALDELMAQHLAWLTRRVRARLGTRLRTKVESTDIVQDSMLQFLRYGPGIQVVNEASFRRLMARIIENVIRDESGYWCMKRRDMAREQELPDEAVLRLGGPLVRLDAPDARLARAEEFARARLALELMNPGSREIYLLRRRDELPFKEIGDLLGIGEGTADARYRRAARLFDTVHRKLRTLPIDDVLEGLQSEEANEGESRAAESEEL